jgi:tRNA dimethylallyltransferase
VPALPLVAVFGPTGVGKTAVAVALGERLRAAGEDPVAVSADALQVYRGLEVLTGAATASERARLEHRLVGILPVTATFSAGAYARRAHTEVDALVAQGRRPIVVGGTGLYLRAALAELDLRPPVPPAVRERWNARLAAEGAPAGVREADAQRIVRALELLDAGHEPPPPSGAASQLWTADTRHPTLLAGLVMERAALYARIDARVEAMVRAGAAEEVRAADAAGASATVRAAVGFEELLRGDVAGMRARTRRYAKRQLTWMRRLPGARLLDVTDRAAEDVAAELHGALRAWPP